MCPIEFIITHLNSIMPILISSILTIAISFIAFQQFLLAKEKFKLDMFEKRLVVFKAVQKFICETVKGSVPSFVLFL